MSGVCALVAGSALALAQSVECKKTETQAECHARLKCKPNEELEDCKKRLRAEGQGQGGGREADDRGGDRGGDERGSDRGGDDRGGDRGSDRGRDRGGDDEGRGRRGRDDDRGGGGDDGGSSRRGRRGGSGSKSFEANKTFGLGLELGEPTGLNGKYFLSESGALDFGLGWIYRHYYYGDGFHIYGDYLWHPLSLVSAEAFELPLYIGGGLRFWDFDYCIMRVCNYGGSAIGIRIPFGIAFDFNNIPLDIFIQLVPVIDFLRGDYYDRYRDRTHFGVDVSAGIRFWFK